jgi:UDP-glucose 4-epimerase
VSRVVVFGGTGFIGSALCTHLASLGHEILALGRHTPSVLPANVCFKRIEFESPETWNFLISEGDYVCHLISTNLPNSSEKAGEEEKALKLMEELLKVCVSKKIKNFLFLSSGGSIYGQANKVFREDDELHPISPYGKLKLHLESTLRHYQEYHELPLVIARPSNVYGESQNPAQSFGVITNFYNRISKNMPIEIFGDLSICKDYLHVSDLVPVLGQMCLGNKKGIFNLGYGTTHTLQDVISIIEAILDKKAVCKFYPFRITDIHHYSLNSHKAFEELNFNPIIDLETGIMRYYKNERT